MRYFLLLAALSLLFGVVTAAPAPADTAVLRINRLPAQGGLLLQKGWRYHAGDDPAWARPDFDDSAWDTLNPTRPRRELPPVVGNGMSWLRLRLHLGDSLNQHDLLLGAWEMGAVEVYLNGRLVLQQGVLHADPARVQPRGRFPGPGAVPAGGPAEQVLAVRFAPWRAVLPLGLEQSPQFLLSLRSPEQFWVGQAQERNVALVYLVLFGFSGLLAFLHAAFFHYNPTQRANRYFARFALTVALASLLAYCSRTAAFPTFPLYWTIWVLTNSMAAMNGLWAIRALYALFGFRPGRLYTGLWVAYGALVALQCLSVDRATVIGWLAIIVVNIAEQLRLTVRALRQQQRGARLIASGFGGGLLAALGYCAVVYLIEMPPLLKITLENMLLALGFVLPALSISLFLAREFARDAELLQVKLGEVERLSAQTLAQEQEKQLMLAQQNDTLEHQVQERTGELQRSLTELRATQAQLIQKEKMASLGELTAGIAHEIQNPLNFVNNFSEVSSELVAELKEAQAASDAEEVAALTNDLEQNLGKITEHGKRAAAIVKGMLEHSRQSTGERAPTNLNQLCEEYLRLAYQGLRAKDKTFNAALATDFAPDVPLVEAVGADLGRVLLNLFGNAFYAVRQRQQAGAPSYAPTVRVSTRRGAGQVEIRVADNGTGMPAEVQAKIFQPFFTTKPTGEGTGLGLSLSHDIVVQGHGGTLSVTSEPGQGTEFLMRLPA